jgi:ribosome-associated protein
MDKELQAVFNVCDALDKKFGIDIVIMDIREKTSLADYFVIATGGSSLQLTAMSDAAEDSMKKDGIALYHAEGIRSNWKLLDYGNIIIHLFDKEGRAFYNLERVWGDARIIKRENPVQPI